MRTPGSAAELEARRRIAGRLLLEGNSIADVARTLDVSYRSVRRWKLAIDRGGIEALAAKPHPGRPPRLSHKQRKKLERLLLKGPLKLGFSTDLWTCTRVAELIEREFEVSYHKDHVWRVLNQLGWTCQKPEPRPREQDPEQVQRWREQEWPRIKKGPSRQS